MIASQLSGQILAVYVWGAIGVLLLWPFVKLYGLLHSRWRDWRLERWYRGFLALPPDEQEARRRENVERYRASGLSS